MIKNDVKNISIKKAAFINAAANYSCVILQLGFSAVLARILLPEDYGVIGVMTVFTTFFSVLANMGIGTAVIQNKELSDYDVSNIFTFNLYVAVGLSIIFAIFSVPLSKFYGNSVYIVTDRVLAFGVFVFFDNEYGAERTFNERKKVRAYRTSYDYHNCCKQRYSDCIGKTRTEILRTCRTVYYTGYGQFYMELQQYKDKT